MLKGRLCKILAVSLAMTLAGLSLHAQDGAYTGFTPYSIFGIGDIFTQGSAYNKGMGGVGIATRNKRYINYLNPASITASRVPSPRHSRKISMCRRSPMVCICIRRLS